MPETAVATGIMFLAHPILVSMVSQERLQGIPSNLEKMMTWTQERTLNVGGQRSKSL